MSFRSAGWIANSTFVLAAVLTLSSIAHAQPKALAAVSDSDAVATSIQTFLVNTGKFSAVDIVKTNTSTPTLATLQGYDCVVVTSNNVPQDAVTLGNNMADYVDGGGGVVEVMFTMTNGWSLKGRWVNYSTMNQDDNSWLNTSDQNAGTVHDANHPIIAGITNLTNGGRFRRNLNVLANGASKVLDWTDGTVCVAANDTFAGAVACVNMYMPANDAGGSWNPANCQIDELLAQALEWVATGGLPTIADPAAGPLPDAYTDQGYNQTITGQGGAEPYVWTISGGSLPTGLTLNSSTGVISGTPSSLGSHTFDVLLTDNNNDTDSRSYSIFVYAPPQITVPSAGALADALINTAYGPVNFSTSGGKPALVWSITSGALPVGISQNTSTGAISGTPTTVSNNNFTVRVTDANGRFHERAYSIAVFDTPVITSPSSGAITPEGYVGDAYSRTFTAAGGVPAYTWSLQSGSLPPGLALNTNTGVLSGPPSAAGIYAFTIRVTDTNNDFDQLGYTLEILDLPAITSPSPGALPQATRNAPNYSQSFTASNGKSPLSWSATGLPAGMSINSGTGVLSGTPTASGAFNINVTVTDANGKTDVDAWTLQVAAAVALTGSSLPDAEEETLYSQTPGNSGGTGPYAWTMFINPALPDLSMDPSTGLITGTPSAGTSNNYTVTVTLTDSLGGTANKNYTFYVTQPGGGTAANCGCTSSATTRDNAFAGWLLLLLPMLLLVARRRV
ncbi:MAG: putative Ig domain-containing protein [Planctomycetota bacterium]